MLGPMIEERKTVIEKNEEKEETCQRDAILKAKD